MSSRPWVVVDAPDSRGLRAVTVGGRPVGRVRSLRALRRVLERSGLPDVDLEDPASVCWRGGGSGAWPDRAWRRRVTVVLMMAGLLASAALNAVIGWPDASGALTFPQRMAGALFVLSGVVQCAAAVLVLDHWGRRELPFSGAIVLLGALIALATDTLLLVMWLEEREDTPYLRAFLPLWCWSLWALYVLIREKSWRGVGQPRKFAAGVFASALLTAVSLAYSTMYQPAVAPVRFALKAEFGTARSDPGRPFVHVPLRLSVKNTGQVSVSIVISDVTVYGRTATYSGRGSPLLESWKESLGKDSGGEEAERHVDGVRYATLSSVRFYEPGDVLESGQEDTRQRVFQLPRDTRYDLLRVDLQITYVRKDRGRVDREFGRQHKSWDKQERYYCHPAECGEKLIWYGRVRHDNNLVNVTRRPRFMTAWWRPTGTPVYFVSTSYDFGAGEAAVDPFEVKKETRRYGISTVATFSEVSVAELLRASPSPRPS